MKIRYDKGEDGLCVRRCFGVDGNVRLPERIGREQIKELGAYAFSESAREEAGACWTWDSEEGSAPIEDTDMPICGNRLEQISLPEGLAKIGAYAFYNCEKLEALTCSSAIDDLGPGIFTGCTALKRLDIRIIPGRKSCLREILSELRQTMGVTLRDGGGKITARLVFTEYFEESTENTPARLTRSQIHGCGHMYRYCFENTRFQFQEYDALFPHVKVQEEVSVVTELALWRLLYPWELGEEAGQIYWAYIREHTAEAAVVLLEEGDMKLLEQIASSEAMEKRHLDEMAEQAGLRGDAQAAGILLDIRHRRFRGAERRRFML